MKIFVSGGYGFIGSNFILNQINSKSNNDQILNYDKLTYAGNIANLKSLENNKNYTFVKGDICNSRLLQSVINKFKPDKIVHFAAESHVDRSIDGPMTFVNTNLVGTATLLDVLNSFIKEQTSEFKQNFKMIHISTDEVYGSLGKKGFFNEKTSYDPSSPYSSSKAGSDHLVRAWNKTYGLPTIITNCSNNYGPYQFPEKLIPLIIANCLDNKILPVYGNGLNIRDWLYVIDHCNAISTLLKKGKSGETYNIGGNNEIKNIDIILTICKIMDEIKPSKTNQSYSKLITYVEDRPGHDFRYAIDATKIKNEINWIPKESFNSGIRKTIKWYLENEEWWRKIQNKSYNQERLGLI